MIRLFLSWLLGAGPVPRAWKRHSVVDLEQVDPTPVLCSASIVLALRRRGRVSA